MSAKREEKAERRRRRKEGKAKRRAKRSSRGGIAELKAARDIAAAAAVTRVFGEGMD